MKSLGHYPNRSKEQQRQEFLQNLVRYSTTKVTDNWLKMAQSLWCEAKYKKIIEENQNYLNFFGNTSSAEDKKETFPTIDDPFKDDSSDEYDSGLMETLTFFENKANKKLEIHPNLDPYVEEFENIFYRKSWEFATSLGSWSLSESDLKVCFELACKEFSSLHPWTNHTRLFSLLSDKFF